jgi:hypothetical protein
VAPSTSGLSNLNKQATKNESDNPTIKITLNDQESLQTSNLNLDEKGYISLKSSEDNINTNDPANDSSNYAKSIDSNDENIEKSNQVLIHLNENSTLTTIDHRNSHSSSSSSETSKKLENVLSHLDREYTKSKAVSTGSPSSSSQNNKADENSTPKKHTPISKEEENVSSSTVSINADATNSSNINPENSSTYKNININNTINSRYKQFEKKKRNCSINSQTNSIDAMMMNSNANPTSTSTANQSSSSGSNTPPVNGAISINTNIAHRETFDFTLRINKLRFIDDSASSTALTSPAESLNHLYFGPCSGGTLASNGSLSKKNKKILKQQQRQHNLLNSSNYPPAVCTISHPNETTDCATTSSSRTVSLPPSTNCSISNSACSTPAFNNPKLKSSRLTNRMVMIKRQANVKSSSETLNSDDQQARGNQSMLPPTAAKLTPTNNHYTSNDNTNKKDSITNNNLALFKRNLCNSPVIKLNKVSSTSPLVSANSPQQQHEMLVDNLAAYRAVNQSNQVKLLQQKMTVQTTGKKKLRYTYFYQSTKSLRSLRLHNSTLSYVFF